MINILYDNIKNTTRVELSSFNIFNNHQLPLTVEFKNYVNDTLAWSHKLYEGGEGYTDTIDKKVISKFLKEDEIKSYTSVSINDIFKQNDENFNWLYLDAEGADADLILSLKYYPDLIIFEPDHINNDKHVELIDWFHINNYKIFKEDDYIAIKNKNIEIEKK